MISLITYFGILSSEELVIDSTKVKDPSFAWKIAFIPSAGQIYNKDYHKVIGFWLLESYSIYKFNAYHKQGNRVGNRNTYAWWTAGLYIMSILDAYIDAQLSTFPVKVDKTKEKESK